MRTSGSNTNSLVPSFHGRSNRYTTVPSRDHADYVREAERLLRDHGLLCVDNAFAWGQLLDDSATDGSVLAIKEVNRSIASSPSFEGAMVALGDGFWFCTRTPRSR